MKISRGRAQMCPCGHEATWHTGLNRSCQYGHGHVMGGCTCVAYRSRRYRDGETPVVVAPAPPALEVAFADLAKAVQRALDDFARTMGLALVPRVEPRVSAPSLATARVPRPTSTTAAAGDVKLRKGERKILEVLARHQPNRLTRPQLGALTGIKGGGTTMGTYLGVLKRNKLIELDEDVGLTPAGLALTGPTRHKPMTRDEIVAVWKNALRAGERNMLDAVISNGGEMTRDALGAVVQIDPHGTTFGTYLGVLKRNDLFIVRGSTVRLGAALAIAS